mgnify:CR=1 FL=1
MTGLFVGSFDPFTIGHDDIVRRALPLFTKLVIGVGVNPEKHCMFPAEERIGAIQRLYRDEPKIEVVGYTDFSVDLAHRVGAQFIVKGVRTVTDFEYEQVQAEYNRRLGNIETLLLYAKPEYMSISSTAVRTLLEFHKDVSWMLPRR